MRAQFDSIANRGITLSLAIWLAACASTTEGFSPGFFASPVGDDGYYVRYDGSAFGSDETVQIYWLYNCAVLTLSKGYDGFQIDSSQLKVDSDRGPDVFAVGAIPALVSGLLAQGKDVQYNIRLVNKPFDTNAVTVFDAVAVKAAFEPYVKDHKTCRSGEMCPHPADFLKGASSAAK